MVKFGFRPKRRGAASLDQWFSEPLPMVGLWQRRLTTDATVCEAAPEAGHTESCCFLCVLCALCGFPDPFRKIIKNPLNQAGDDPAKSSEKFKQAFMEAFGRTGDGSTKPQGRLQQMLQRIMLWRRRIG